MVVLHLIRDPRESIQGLCDGWNYPFGFQTLPSVAQLDIPGYISMKTSDDNSVWKRHRLNFSVDRGLSIKLIEEERTESLVRVCAHQWYAAHARILEDCAELSLHRVPLLFSDLRNDAVSMFADLSKSLGIDASASGIQYAKNFGSRVVMATQRELYPEWTRWMRSPYTEGILGIVARPRFRAIVDQLIPEWS
jgi:hypothetical protein